MTALLRALPLAGPPPDAVAAFAALLDDGERERAARFRSSEDARAYVSAHALLRLTLSEACPEIVPADWRFQSDERGKPHIANPSPVAPRFSLTHARGLVGCAVSFACDPGVDAESLDRNVQPLPLARRFFTVCEADALAEITDEGQRRRAFLRLWTLKEAVVKATGSGLAQSLQGVSFSLTDPPSAHLDDPMLNRAEDWRFQRNDIAGHSLALALRGPLAQEIDIDFQIVEPPI